MMQDNPPIAPVEAESRSNPVVRLDGLSFAYQGCAVFENLGFAVGHGEFVAVLGTSGSGKSTLLRVIAGLLRPSSGTVAVEPVVGAQARPLALVFQDPRLLPWRSVRGNVEFGIEGLGLRKAERRQRAMEALAQVGLADLAGRWPHQLSGGQRQRVGLARALAVRPNLLLMDEPFSALDPATRQTLQDLVLELWRGSGTSVVFVTHDVTEAAILADRVVVLGGTPARLLHQVGIDLHRPRRRNAPESAAAADLLHGLIGPAAGPRDHE